MVELSVQSALDATTENRIFKWSDENLMTQLPLQPDSSASLTLYLYAATDFVAPSIRNGNIYSNFHVLKDSSFVNNYQFLRCYQQYLS